MTTYDSGPLAERTAGPRLGVQRLRESQRDGAADSLSRSWMAPSELPRPPHGVCLTTEQSRRPEHPQALTLRYNSDGDPRFDLGHFGRDPRQIIVA